MKCALTSDGEVEDGDEKDIGEGLSNIYPSLQYSLIYTHPGRSPGLASCGPSTRPRSLERLQVHSARRISRALAHPAGDTLVRVTPLPPSQCLEAEIGTG